MAMNKKELIYLDEAIARIQNEGVYGEGYSDSERIDNVCDILEGCHIVDAIETVYGQWLYDDDHERYFCSVCKEEAICTYIDKPIYDYDWEENLRYSHTDTLIEEYLTKYCPNCGAKMRR